MINLLKTHINLLLHSSKDYIYSFKYSDKESIKINPYDPKSSIIANNLMNEINKVCPLLKLYLIGSVGLRIEGRGDIDIYATAPLDKFKEAILKIATVFGKPVKIRKNQAEWKFKYNCFSVEIVLTNPQDKSFLKQIRLFNLLKNNKLYLREYRNLKNGLNNRSEKEYIRKRMEFFNRILSSNLDTSN